MLLIYYLYFSLHFVMYRVINSLDCVQCIVHVWTSKIISLMVEIAHIYVHLCILVKKILWVHIKSWSFLSFNINNKSIPSEQSSMKKNIFFIHIFMQYVYIYLSIKKLFSFKPRKIKIPPPLFLYNFNVSNLWENVHKKKKFETLILPNSSLKSIIDVGKQYLGI